MGISSDHVEPARVPGAVAIEHVTGRTNDVGVDHPEKGVPTQPCHAPKLLRPKGIARVAQPLAHLSRVRGHPASEGYGLLGAMEDETRGPRHPVVEHEGAHSARLAGGDHA